LDLLTRIKNAASLVNAQSEDTREKLYYHVFNATVLTFRTCR